MSRFIQFTPRKQKRKGQAKKIKDHLERENNNDFNNMKNILGIFN